MNCAVPSSLYSYTIVMQYPIKKLRASRERLIEHFTNGQDTHAFPEEHTALMDQYFRDALQESQAGTTLQQRNNPFALIALGGYGRRELCLYSDIDILLLFKKAIPAQAKELIEEILFPLWDLGLELGHATRSLNECLTLAKKDFEVLTSIMDARFISGDYTLFLDLVEKLHTKVLPKNARPLNVWLVEQNKLRLEEFGDSAYLLEPNLKEGIGGLRDYHHMLWLANAYVGLREPRDLVFLAKLSNKEYQELQRQVLFLLVVRNHLHHISGRKNDRVVFEYQEKIADRLGLHDYRESRAVEQFNSKLHATMAAIKSLTHSFIISHFPAHKIKRKRAQTGDMYPGLTLDKGELTFRSASNILENSFLLMAIFEHSARLGHPLSLEAKRLVREFLYLADVPFRESTQVVNSFVKIMTEPWHTFETLDQMMEVGFLGALIPEFDHVKDRVEFDAYHIYPVGMHTLHTVRYLKGLRDEKDMLLTDLFLELLHPDRLVLAGFFHDIGKIGTDHATHGADITRKIVQRFDMDEEATEDICFLVRNHLLLVETATRRDLNDEKAMVQCARTVGSVERLKMLYLLTWADSRATGPKAWSEWIANLINELFFKVIHILERKELATQDAASRVAQTKSGVRRNIGSIINNDELNHYFEIMPPRYLLNTSAQEIIHHLRLAEQLKKKQKTIGGATEEQHNAMFMFESRRDKASDCWELTVLTMNRRGLFSNIAGVLTLNNINILSADIYTWRDETAVDVLRVTNPPDDLFLQETWNKIQEDFKAILADSVSLESQLREKTTSAIITEQKKPSRPPQVIVDNDSSDFFTVIEVFADDHIGLLYRMTHTLFNLGLDIHLARISTKGDQIADIFYVRDIDGQKVEDKNKVKEIKRTLLRQLKEL
jgi:[protein-PII] uridylyltransferase